eukprot:751172-Hanusia_phi.AAC.16
MQFPPYPQQTQNQSLSSINQSAANFSRKNLLDFQDVANRLQSISNRDLSSGSQNKRYHVDGPSQVQQESKSKGGANKLRKTKDEMYQDMIIKEGYDKMYQSTLEAGSDANSKNATIDALSKQLELSKSCAMKAYENYRLLNNEKPKKPRRTDSEDSKVKQTKDNGKEPTGSFSEKQVGSEREGVTESCAKDIITIDDSDEDRLAASTEFSKDTGQARSPESEMQDYVVVCPHPKCRKKIAGRVEKGTIGVQRIVCPFCDCKIDCVHDVRSSGNEAQTNFSQIKEEKIPEQQILVDVNSRLLDEALKQNNASSYFESRLRERLSLQDEHQTGISIEEYSSIVQSQLQKCLHINYAEVAANKVREPLPPLPPAVPMEDYIKSVLSSSLSFESKQGQHEDVSGSESEKIKQNEADGKSSLVIDTDKTSDQTSEKKLDNPSEENLDKTSEKNLDKTFEKTAEKTAEKDSHDTTNYDVGKQKASVTECTQDQKEMKDYSSELSNGQATSEVTIDLELGDCFVENLLVSWGIIRRTANILQLPDLDMEAFLLAISGYGKQQTLKTYVDDLHISLLKELCKEFRRPEHQVRNISALNVHTWPEGLRFYILWMSRNIYVALVGCRKDECNEKHDPEESSMVGRPEVDEVRERMNVEMSSSAEKLNDLASKLWKHPYTDLKLDERFVILRFLCERLLQMYDVRKEMEEEEVQGHLMMMMHKDVLKAMHDEEAFVFPERSIVY